MADRFRKTISDIDSPAEFAFEIPDMHTGGAHTTVEVGVLAVPTRAIYVGNTGNLFCRMVNTYNSTFPSDSLEYSSHGANVFFRNVTAGTILPLRLDAIWANNYEDHTSNTTAVGLVGLY